MRAYYAMGYLSRVLVMITTIGEHSHVKTPNARGEPHPEAAAERRLLGVGSSALFGAGPGTDAGTPSCCVPGAAQGIDSHPPYRITSSAWKRMVGGIVSPSASAVLRLMTSSNFIGCSTGKSAGLAPFRILST